jgi:hypothetical protein
MASTTAPWSSGMAADALRQQRHKRTARPTLVTMPEDDQAPGSHQRLRQSEPDVRPLGFIAIGFAIVTLILAPSYFLSLLAYLSAVPAVVLGFIARGETATRGLGNAALVIAGTAIVCATCVVLFWY